MIGPSPVEELAWLVKDNLHAKYLVLSVEELFVEFLECPLRFNAKTFKIVTSFSFMVCAGESFGLEAMYLLHANLEGSEEETLALEPMVSYQRMLLHRLADLFRLAHESVGEGDNRHLLVEKCEDSLIPAVLVSDILDGVSGDGQQQHLDRQILKRDAAPADSLQTTPASKSSLVPLEDRQVAYSAARRRIFSGTLKYAKDGSTERESTRPKSDPMVARRMIAHALGKSKKLTFMSPSQDVVPAQDLHSQVTVGGGGDEMLDESPGNRKVSVSTDSKESMQTSSVTAARRMFANALGLPHMGTSPKLTSSPVFSKTGTCSGSSKRGEETTSDCSLQRNGDLDSTKGESVEANKQCDSFDRRENRRALRVRSAPLGGAGCRIFVQALGLRDPVFN